MSENEYPTDAVHRLKIANGGRRRDGSEYVEISYEDRDTIVAYIEAIEAWFALSADALDRVTDAVLCLCCGNYYPLNGDCPNVELLPHSIERAVSVAARVTWKRRHEGEPPRTTQNEVLAALAEIDGPA
jgi:hypothetical protein